MKNISIKTRITIWFSLLMSFIIIFVLAFMLLISRFAVDTNTKETMIKMVEEAVEEIEFEDGKLDIDDDLSFLNNGVYLQIYDGQGQFLEGVDLSIQQELINNQIQSVTVNNQTYYMFDKYVSFEDGETLWIRGIISATEGNKAIELMIKIAVFLLPIFLIIGAIGGYLIVRYSLKPLDTIQKTANEIGESKDLSRRINLKKGKDEVHQIAATFDAMFERLEKAFKKEQQFTSDVSHELRTPIAVIRSQAEVALTDLSSVEEYQESFKVVKRQSDKMAQLVSRLLQLSRMDRNTTQLELETFDIGELLEIICEDFLLINDKNIQLNQTIIKGITIHADKSLLSRLILNLLNNAYQYGKENGYINLSLLDNLDTISIIVEDNGIGIDEDSQTKIFDRFFRVSQSRSQNEYENMGLGLSMAYEIATLHNGSITVRSKINEGSSFTLILPKKN